MCRIAVLLVVATLCAEAESDPRNIANGVSIYEHGYCDQPYVVVTDDGAWVCVFTTSAEREGAASQYIVCSMSRDKGQTWSAPFPIEEPNGPEASWAMPLLTPFGRIYVFYVYNGDDVRTLPDGGKMRADTHGWYCFRWSDDNGGTWSERRRLPMRITACDRGNDFGGEVQMFWGIGKPVTFGGTAWFAFSKLSRYFLIDSEGWFYRSDNVLNERDVDKVVWELLPEGDHGVRNPDFGSVQEEHNIVPLSNGDLYCVYRTTRGHAVETYSRDGGRTWSMPQPMRYADGRIVKNPRACPRLWRCKNGNYLFWYHNHGGTDFSERNPAWLAGGIERDGVILWSEPEILLYGADRSYDTGRFSYPDLIEQDGRYWVTTTQKTRATVHAVDTALIEGLWAQFDAPELPEPVFVLGQRQTPLTDTELKCEEGFTLVLELNGGGFDDDELLLDARDERGVGVAVTGNGGLVLHDGTRRVEIPSCGFQLRDGRKRRLAIVADFRAAIVLFVVDGTLWDGGDSCQYGWQRLPDDMKGMRMDGGDWRIHDSLSSVSVYARPLRVSELTALKK